MLQRFLTICKNLMICDYQNTDALRSYANISRISSIAPNPNIESVYIWTKQET